MQPFSDIRQLGELDGFTFESTCREHAFYAYLGGHTGVCRVLSKYKLFVDTRDAGVVPHLIMDGFWETWLTQCLARLVQPGDVCFDIGANFGYYTVLMSELAGHAGRTIAIEPNPELCRVLLQTQNVHGWPFDIVEAAASAGNEETILNIPVTNPGDASIIRRSDRPEQITTPVVVNTLTIDAIVEQLGLLKVDIIKIDVEGAEPLVFEGMRDTIARNPNLKILMEYSPFLYSDPRAFADFLVEHFTIHRIKDVETMQLLDGEDMRELLSLTDHTDLYLENLQVEKVTG